MPIAGTFAGLGEGETIWVGPYSFTISYVAGVGNNDVVLTFSGVALVDLSGRVFDDRNNDGLFNGADAGIPACRCLLDQCGRRDRRDNDDGSDGRYTFSDTFAAGTYRIVAGQAIGLPRR